MSAQTKARPSSGVHEVPATVESLRERMTCPDHGLTFYRCCDGCAVALGWRRRFEVLARAYADPCDGGDHA